MLNGYLLLGVAALISRHSHAVAVHRGAVSLRFVIAILRLCLSRCGQNHEAKGQR
jgi:hypothetical protein